jgi:hypothetical protein
MLERYPRPNPVAPLLLLLALSLPVGAARTAAGAAPSSAKPAAAPALKNPTGPAKKAQDLVQSLEAGTFKGSREELGSKVEAAERDLQTYTKRNPNDEAGVLLMMRLYEAGMRSRMYDLSHKSGDFDTTAALSSRMAALRDKITAPYNTVLDRALTRAPGNAEFHYWKGRLYALFEPLRNEGQMDAQHSTLPQAIQEMRRAVALSAADVKYREGLAALLLANGQDAEATAIYRDLNGGRHPMYLLLHDWERVKLPQKTVVDQASTTSLVQRSQFRGKDYALARSRAFLYPGTAAQFMNDCAKRWPAFRLVQRAAQKGDRSGLKSYSQIFTWKGDALAPSASSEKNLQKAPQGGIGINVFEMRAPQAKKPDSRLGVPPGKVYCAIALENFRTVQGK